MKKVVLIGFATGFKSSVGQCLADKFNAKFVDTDVEIERSLGLSVQQIFDTHGEKYFRQKENELLLSLASKQDVVVACGGGSVTVEGFPQFAKDSVVVWLKVTASTVKSRLGGTPRPLFDGLDEQQLQHYIDVRSPLYERYADVTISTDDLAPMQIAEILCNKLCENNL